MTRRVRNAWRALLGRPIVITLEPLQLDGRAIAASVKQRAATRSSEVARMRTALALLRGYVDPGENFDSDGWRIINDALGGPNA